MVAVNSFMVPLGTPAPDFVLPSVEGCRVSLTGLADASAVLVIFLSNHCPYVRRIETAIGRTVAEYQKHGVATVGICSNDTRTNPDDGPEYLAEQVRRAGFTFPVLVDENQGVARAYRAACTPDIFVYDSRRKLAYRGEFDAARPGNDLPPDGATLRAALDSVLDGRPVPEPHTPSIGCDIKWRQEQGEQPHG